MGWTSCQNQIDFLHDACHFLKDENGSYVNTAPHIPGDMRNNSLCRHLRESV